MRISRVKNAPVTVILHSEKMSAFAFEYRVPPRSPPRHGYHAISRARRRRLCRLRIHHTQGIYRSPIPLYSNPRPKMLSCRHPVFHRRYALTDRPIAYSPVNAVPMVFISEQKQKDQAGARRPAPCATIVGSNAYSSIPLSSPTPTR